MKIIVTGGCGFIGGTLIRKLLIKKDISIYNIDKYGYASDHKGIENVLRETGNKNYKFIKLDLKDKKQLTEIIISIKPDLIMHLAAESHVDRSIDFPGIFIESNIVGTFNLLEASREYLKESSKYKKSKFLFHHISTDEVFGSDMKKSFKENSLYNPSSPYSSSKASTDLAALSFNKTYKLFTITSHSSNNFGPGHHKEKFIPTNFLLMIGDS